MLLVRMVLPYSEGGAHRKEWLLDVGVSVLVPLSRSDVERLEAKRRLLAEERRLIEAATKLSRVQPTFRLPGR
jgi:hypothetical protein